MARGAEELSQALAAAAGRRLGGPVTIEGLRRLSGGAVADTWSFDAITGGERLELILRLARSAQTSPLYPDKTTEARVQHQAAEAGVPTPRVRFILEEEDGLGLGYAMERIPGETIARKILREDEFARARPKMARQCGEILARIHAVDTGALPKLAELDAKTQLDQIRQAYEVFGNKHPVFEVAFRWLEDRLPEKANPRLVHADFRNGNFIVGPEGIRSVLDWEMTHLGDPLEDMGWLCVNSWRFGQIDFPVGGFGLREDLWAGYQAAGGEEVDPERVRFWEVFGTLKWGIITLVQAFTHLGGVVRSVELAAIGRRPSETELDLLDLLS
ncbi:MAG: phosphotransferase family protein [Proteobacteria bacterium]|nr:phosphotransferase family protein [Pseudomonadota bacterium]